MYQEKTPTNHRTYHVIGEIKNNYRCVVEADSPTEALKKFNEGEFIDFDFLNSEPLVAVEVMLASE